MAAEPQLHRASYFSVSTHIERDYFLYLPPGYDGSSAKKWPLIFYLHGNGERGDGKGELPRLLRNGPVREAWIRKRDLPFIIVAPQLPMYDRGHTVYNPRSEVYPERSAGGLLEEPAEFRGIHPMSRSEGRVDSELNFSFGSAAEGLPGSWDDCRGDLERILSQVIDSCHVDLSRLYLTGLSYGGYGTWSWAAADPSRWAAIAPICGAADLATASRFVDPELPIWMFHGGRDEVILSDWSYPMANALEAAGHKSVRFTVHEELGHNVWDRVYRSRDFYDWLASQKQQVRV